MVLFFYLLFSLSHLLSTTLAYYPSPNFTNSKTAITTSPKVIPNAYIIQVESHSNSTANQKRQSQNPVSSLSSFSCPILGREKEYSWLLFLLFSSIQLYKVSKMLELTLLFDRPLIQLLLSFTEQHYKFLMVLIKLIFWMFLVFRSVKTFSTSSTRLISFLRFSKTNSSIIFWIFRTSGQYDYLLYRIQISLRMNHYLNLELRRRILQILIRRFSRNYNVVKLKYQILFLLIKWLELELLMLLDL